MKDINKLCHILLKVYSKCIQKKIKRYVDKMVNCGHLLTQLFIYI